MEVKNKIKLNNISLLSIAQGPARTVSLSLPITMSFNIIVFMTSILISFFFFYALIILYSIKYFTNLKKYCKIFNINIKEVELKYGN